jgi:hypothetical protein
VDEARSGEQAGEGTDALHVGNDGISREPKESMLASLPRTPKGKPRRRPESLGCG